MRWVGVGAIVLLAGCSRDNPLFLVDSIGDVGTAVTAAPDTGDESSAASQTGSSGPQVGSSTGDDGPSTGSPDTDSGVADTTSGPDTGTSETSGQLETSGTDAGESGSSTGDELVEGTVWHDLYTRCDHAMTKWTAGLDDGLECALAKPTPAPPWAGHFLEDYEFPGHPGAAVLALAPEPGVNEVRGLFDGLTLPGAAVNPHLRTIVVCPGPGACDIEASIRVQIEGGEYFIGVEDEPLGDGESYTIDLPLGGQPDIMLGKTFNVEVVVLGKSGAATNRGFWLDPRIVELAPP